MISIRNLATCGVVTLAFAGLCVHAQEVHVSAENGIVTLSVAAQKPYSLMGRPQSKTPVISVACQHKGKKIGHSILFSAGTTLAQKQYSNFGSTAYITLDAVFDGHRQSTSWASAGTAEDYAYFGKTEPERIQFLQMILGARTMTIEFTPFLSGMPVSSTFELTGLRAEFDKHPECAMP